VPALTTAAYIAAAARGDTPASGGGRDGSAQAWFPNRSLAIVLSTMALS
jgi:hypothetical protein